MVHAARGRLRALAAVATPGPWKPIVDTVPELLDEIDRLEAEIEQHHAKSTCCCGNYMTEHGLGDGHSPVSMYDYALDQTQSQLQTARWQIGQQIKVISSESERAD